ncbi:MAG TPA: SdrD B-like domain-containing protein [bacterium]|nr:SdrD B-like domain-containing protein [bacterium]
MRALVFAGALIFAAASSAAAAAPVRVVVDDTPLALSPAPVVQDGFVFLPLRPLAQHFQATLIVDRLAIEVRTADGTSHLLRLGRLEIWSGDLVEAVMEAPTQVMQGTTMVPRGGVDVLFGTLTVWNPLEGLVTITSARTPSPVEAPRRPVTLPAARPAGPPAAAPFVPEFRPAPERLVVASGYVAAGLSLGAETTGTGRIQFRTHAGPERLEGSLALAATPASGGGTITRRTAADALTVGGFTLHDSPLTLYEQGLLGLLYETRTRGAAVRFFGGSIPATSRHFYGATVALQPTGTWLLQGASVYDPATGALVVKARGSKLLREGTAVFAESAWGASSMGSGAAWRLGVEVAGGRTSAAVSYLSLADGFPAMGASALFAGRHGPLLSLSYQPSASWTFSGSAALLRGAVGGDRYVAGALVQYRPVPGVGLVGEGRFVEDTVGGVPTRSTFGQLALTVTRGPWGVVLAGSSTADAGILTGTAARTTVATARLGYTLRTGLPVWFELSRRDGDTAAWGYGLGWTFRLGSRTHLSAQFWHRVYTAPAAYTDNTIGLTYTTPLANGADLAVGGGVRYAATGGTAPYVSLQYGVPLFAYGPPQTGRLDATVYVDRNANGARDPEERSVAGIVLRVDGRRAAVTDEAGAATVEGVRAGEVTVEMDDRTLPAGLVAPQPAQRVQVVSGQTRDVVFALLPAATVVGVVFHDENGNGRREAGERPLPGVVVRLADSEVFRTADGAGLVLFDHLAPGRYLLLIDARSVPLGYRIRGEGTFVVTVQTGQDVTVEIPLDGRPIIRTF